LTFQMSAVYRDIPRAHSALPHPHPEPPLEREGEFSPAVKRL
jgi:hypothetical protein